MKAQRETMREMYASGLTQMAIAELLGCDQATVHRYVRVPGVDGRLRRNRIATLDSASGQARDAIAALPAAQRG
jgi:predicted transcriptional regulator